VIIPVWRDLTQVHPVAGKMELKNPVDFARMRYKQNIIAGMSEFSYQRQTGRTFRMLIRSLEMVKKNMNVLIIADRASTCKRLADQAATWMSELKMSATVSPRRTSEVTSDVEHKVRYTSGGTITVCTPSKFLEVSRGFRQDVVLFDNSFTDTSYENPTDEFTDTLREVYGACVRKDMMSELKDFQGRSWSLDNLLLMPGSESVGSLVSITRAGLVPTAVSVLHEGNIYTFPISMCDIFVKPDEKINK
jgi:hypothetical protein